MFTGIAKKLFEKWGVENAFYVDRSHQPHEAGYLKLESSLAQSKLRWRPNWDIEKALDAIVEWTDSYQRGEGVTNVCLNQITEFTEQKEILQK